MDNKLLKRDFLTALFEQQHRELYARITSLDINNNPIEQIEGKVTDGNINIDGASSVRRTCNLTIISQNININDYRWGLKTKFKLEIGLRNQLIGAYAPDKYPEVIWFPQGYFLIANFNISYATNSCTISISGKDKMCLLNGDLGGQLFASIDFGTEDTENLFMDQVELSSLFPSSKEAMNNLSSYYIKPITDFTFNNMPNISENDKRYVFILNQKTGNYYKEGSVYKPANGYRYENNNIYERGNGQSGTPINNPYFYYLIEPNNLKRDSTKKYYDMYKKIETPDELFQDAYFFKSNKYRKWNSSADRIEPVSSYSDISSSNYKDRYILINNNRYALPVNIKDCSNYQKRKYYIQNENQNNYYILNNSTVIGKGEGEKNQYELVPIYSVRTEIERKKIPIKKIIQNAVHVYAGEPYQNIIIKDLDEYGLEQLIYKGDIPLYALYDVEMGQFTNLIRAGEVASLDNILNNEFIFLAKSNEGFNLGDDNNSATKVSVDSNNNYSSGAGKYRIMKIETNQDAGYRLTDLVYAGDLISNIGETLTSVFDKIKTMLGEFEYFYDLEGRFVFQKKPNYIQTTWSQIITNEDETYVNYANDMSKFSFDFQGNHLISALQNQPVLNNLRNDYSIWGKRKSVNGKEIPIHIRYAIDKKPIYYKSLQGIEYISEDYDEDKTNKSIVDWREIIYQMAIDYYQAQGCSEKKPLIISNNLSEYFLTNSDNFLQEVALRNPEYYPSGQTGYEQYYADMEGFWRQLYNPNYTPENEYTEGYYEKTEQNEYIWHDPIVKDTIVQYYPEGDPRAYWNIDVFTHPETLNFWIDFLDNGDLLEFSIPEVGCRSKSVNESMTSAIVYSQVPDFIFYGNEEKDSSIGGVDQNKLLHDIDEKTGYIFIYLPDGFIRYFDISSHGASLKNKLDDYIYQNSYCIENINITAIPIYNLEPNTRIFVQDKNTDIEGEYIINRISLPLKYDGTMTINAYKVPRRII